MLGTLRAVSTYVARYSPARAAASGDDLARAVTAAGATVVERTPTMVLFEATPRQATAIADQLPAGATVSPTAMVPAPAPARPRVRRPVGSQATPKRGR